MASSAFYDSTGLYKIEHKDLVREAWVAYLVQLVDQYPIISIEDGMAEKDNIGWQQLTQLLGHRVQLVGDDLFVTHASLLKKGIAQNLANAVLIKYNQVGTLTETLAAIALAKEANYGAIISHRSGETEDTTIADLVVASGIGQIKTGSVCRTDRVSKYNRLLWIESALKGKVGYGLSHMFGQKRDP